MVLPEEVYNQVNDILKDFSEKIHSFKTNIFIVPVIEEDYFYENLRIYTLREWLRKIYDDVHAMVDMSPITILNVFADLLTTEIKCVTLVYAGTTPYHMIVSGSIKLFFTEVDEKFKCNKSLIVNKTTILDMDDTIPDELIRMRELLFITYNKIKAVVYDICIEEDETYAQLMDNYNSLKNTINDLYINEKFREMEELKLFTGKLNIKEDK